MTLTDFAGVTIKPRFLSPAQRADLEQIVRRPSEDHGVARRANAIFAVHPAAWQGIQRMPEKENTKIALHLAG